tara:strand:- start:92 stop:415 length:324 start_codon:yes stop_codon:yes gene_type:complete
MASTKNKIWEQKVIPFHFHSNISDGRSACRGSEPQEDQGAHGTLTEKGQKKKIKIKIRIRNAKKKIIIIINLKIIRYVKYKGKEENNKKEKEKEKINNNISSLFDRP